MRDVNVDYARLEKARRDSVGKKRSKVKRRNRKIVNYVTLLLLIASLTGNIALLKKIDLNNNKGFNEITYGENYEEEFEDVNNLVEACIKSCIIKQINEDTHRCVDENGIDTGDYYYNFTDYSNVLKNLNVTINTYKMNMDEEQIFYDSFVNLTEEEKAAILIYYGTGFVDFDNNKERFKKHVGGVLIENNASDQMIEALAKGAVHELTGNLLDSHWITNDMGRSH